MIAEKKEHPKEKDKLHLRNRHRERYDFKKLIETCEELAQFVKINIYGDESIDFFNPKAVKTLNKALLNYYYDIKYWDIPQNYLCPPIPGRADYIHYLADLLATKNSGKIPTGNSIKCLDIGVGANCVYPIIGNKEYDWSFIGTDIDIISLKSANKIIELNPFLQGKIELRLQKNPKNIFSGILKENEFIDLTICNPPFHASFQDAQNGSMRKLSNLKHKKKPEVILNFGGQNTELWCEGGEEKFIDNTINESSLFANSCFWFSTLVSKQSYLNNIYETLTKVKATEIKTIEMGQGNKISRIVAWTYMTESEQKKWSYEKWNSKL